MRRFWMLMAWLVAAIPAGAQQLRGVVRDSASGGFLAGTVVTVLDSAGAIATRGITDASGRFTVTLSPRSARLRLIRIGYRPRDLQLPPIAERGVVLQLAMDRLPPMLEAVRVSGSELCPGSADVGAAFQLWEQARAGLLATVVARELRPAKATVLGYERGMSPDNERIHRQKKTIKMGQTTRPFVASAAPSFFAHFGYMIEDNGGRVFNAPDADVLIDESFASTHCFRLQQADAEHPEQIGVAFSPARGRDTLVDVKGTIWIDRKTPQLRSLDFLYTSLEPAAMRMRTGGHIEFRTMENGVSFIERWSLRLPNLQLIPRPPNSPSMPVGLPRTERIDLRVAEISEAGGLVLDALWADGAHWQATLATITGTVTQRRTHAPVLSGVVLLEGTGDTATTGASGDFRITTLPGKYIVNVADTSFAAFVEPRTANTPLEVSPAGTASVRLEVDPIDGVVEELCRGQKIRPNTALIVGHLDQRAMRVPSSASVRATWQADYSGDAMGGRMVTIEQGNQDVRPDGDGRFVVCGVARERPIKMQLIDAGNVLADTSVKVLTRELTIPVEWRLSRAVADDDGAALEGYVRSEADRRPLSGAQVSIADLHVAATTGATGEFSIAHLTPGQHVVQVRQVGSEPLTDTIDFAPRMRRTRTFLLRKATVLDTIRTNAARALSPALRAFEERRTTGQGKYIADSLLRKNDDRRLSDVLSSYLPGLRVQKEGSRDVAVSTRDDRSTKYAMLGALGSLTSRCYTTVYLDGVLIYDKTMSEATSVGPDLNQFSVNQLGAVEFYPGQASLPSQFKSSECGTLLLWTREK